MVLKKFIVKIKKEAQENDLTNVTVSQFNDEEFIAQNLKKVLWMGDWWAHRLTMYIVGFVQREKVD